ncbi:hypothetical protein BC827DRAFT_1220887, partial [Russula dissimulans]
TGIETSDLECPHRHPQSHDHHIHYRPSHTPSVHQPHPYSFVHSQCLIVLPCHPSTPFITLKTDRAPKTRSSPQTPSDPLLGQRHAAVSLKPAVPQNP